VAQEEKRDVGIIVLLSRPTLVLGKSSGLVTSRGVLEATAVALCDASQQQQEEDGPEW